MNIRREAYLIHMQGELVRRTALYTMVQSERLKIE